MPRASALNPGIDWDTGSDGGEGQQVGELFECDGYAGMNMACISWHDAWDNSSFSTLADHLSAKITVKLIDLLPHSMARTGDAVCIRPRRMLASSSFSAGSHPAGLRD
jgi:hypothetical protein